MPLAHLFCFSIWWKWPKMSKIVCFSIFWGPRPKIKNSAPYTRKCWTEGYLRWVPSRVCSVKSLCARFEEKQMKNKKFIYFLWPKTWKIVGFLFDSWRPPAQHQKSDFVSAHSFAIQAFWGLIEKNRLRYKKVYGARISIQPRPWYC